VAVKERRHPPPDPVSDYKLYREQIRADFNYTCFYCDVREAELGGQVSFHLEHYKPQGKFPDEANDYYNLVYACLYCNGHKLQYWPDIVQRLLREIVLNPYQHDPSDHVDKTDWTWAKRSNLGGWNIKRLWLNSKLKRDIRGRRDLDSRFLVNLESQIESARRILIVAEKNGDVAQASQQRGELTQMQRDRELLLSRLGPRMDKEARP
jgi:hypothetical protein